MLIYPRIPLPLLICGLLLAACTPREEPDVEVDDPEEFAEDARVLLGTWVLTEQAGAMPDRVVTLTFTEAGDYILRSEAGGEQRREYVPAGPGLIEVMDAPGAPVELFEYEVTGNTLTLSIPGTEIVSTFERRDDLLQRRDDLTPDTLGPDPIEVPVPDSPDAELDPGTPQDAPATDPAATPPTQ